MIPLETRQPLKLDTPVPPGLSTLLRESGQAFDDLDALDLGPLIERLATAKVVLLGAETHGSSEFYRLRDRITRELVLRHGFNVVAVEADWPDASQVDRYVRGLPPANARPEPFSRFPVWMWRNRETVALIEWLKSFNAEHPDPARQAGFYGLDLFSLFTSAAAVGTYLDTVDPTAAKIARARYACLEPWDPDFDPACLPDLARRWESCETAAVAMMTDLLSHRLTYAAADGYRFFDAAQNARLVASAEHYYRGLYRASRASWNLRDEHMYETLTHVLEERGPDSRAVVWAHNSHCGDAAATDMGLRGEHNLGMLVRKHYGAQAWRVGFGTDHGTVAAASEWDGPMQVMAVPAASHQSVEHVFHLTGARGLLLPLRFPVNDQVRIELGAAMAQRAIGVIYRPDSELKSHYFSAVLGEQFDEYVWIDETRAVSPLPPITQRPDEGPPRLYPFGT